MPLIMFVSSSFNTYVNLPKKKIGIIIITTTITIITIATTTSIIIIIIIIVIVVTIVVVLLLLIIYTINLPVVRPRSCRVIYYFDTPTLGKRHQSVGRVSLRLVNHKEEGQKFRNLGRFKSLFLP